MSTGVYDTRITAYFGDAVMQAGFMPLPHLFLRHYRQLGLSHIQAMFALQLMEIAWDISRPPSSVSKLADRMGVGHRTIQVCSKELHTLGLIDIYDQFDDEGAQVENGYDLSPLFRRLADFAPLDRPTGELRARRPRTRPVREGYIDTGSTTAGRDTTPVQVSTPAPRAQSHRPSAPACTPPVIADSGLKEESKKQIKKQTRIKQQPAAVVRSQDGRIPNLRVSEPEQTGSSLRWHVPLTTAEVIASREVLQRIGLNAVVVNGCASAMHPGECWALWCYARSAKLGIPWMASQIYDFAERRARPTFQALAYDDVGKQLAGLPPGEAEAMLSFLDDQRLHTQLDLHNNAEYNNRDRAQRSLLDALWAVRTEQHRGGQGNRVEHTTGYMGPVDDAVTMEVDPLWVSVRTQVEKQVEQSDFTTWIAPLALLEVLDEIAVIGAPNVFVRNEVTERFSPLIASVLAETVGHFVDVEVVIGSANGVSQN